MARSLVESLGGLQERELLGSPLVPLPWFPLRLLRMRAAMPSAAATTTTMAMPTPVRMKMMRGTRSVKVVLFVWFELTPKESRRFGAGSSAAAAKLGGTSRDARSPSVPSAPYAVCSLQTERRTRRSDRTKAVMCSAVVRFSTTNRDCC